jgi:lipoprotein-releasing system permease protein
MPWYFYLALKQLFPSGRRLPFFTVMSVVGVMLGVTLLIAARSIMGGFGYEIRRMTIDTQGEIQVATRASLDGGQMAQVEKMLTNAPEVAAFAPRAAGVVMLQYHNQPTFPLIQGFDYERMKKVIPLERYLTAGSLDDLDDDSVILSYILARNLGVNVGETVSIYSPLMLERIKGNEVLLPRDVRVAGIFQVGHQQLDSSTVLCSLRLMQDLYGLGQQVHGYNVRLKAGANELDVAARFNNSLPNGTRALTWYESNAEFQAALSFEKNMTTFLISFIVLVAAFAITMSLSSTVVRKTREIGLLAAMGGSARAVAGCFCLQGLMVGLAGSALGWGMAALVLYYRDGIVRFITRFTMGQDGFEQIYQFNHLPAHTETSDLVITLVASVLAATLAGLIPAWRAARLEPVEALRSA